MKSNQDNKQKSLRVYIYDVYLLFQQKKKCLRSFFVLQVGLYSYRGVRLSVHTSFSLCRVGKLIMLFLPPPHQLITFAETLNESLSHITIVHLLHFDPNQFGVSISNPVLHLHHWINVIKPYLMYQLCISSLSIWSKSILGFDLAQHEHVIYKYGDMGYPPLIRFSLLLNRI